MDYIVASCKQWHRQSFVEIKNNYKQHRWYWVDSPEALEEILISVSPQYIFFIHWSWLVPETVWSRFDCVCFHMTDVPYGRGGSPLQNLINRGHKETKMAALKMVENMDAGPVYGKRDLTLDGRAEDIYIRAGQLSFEMVAWIIESLPEPIEQTGEVTFFKRRKAEQSLIPENTTITGLYDFIRMLDAPSYPLAYIDYGEFRLEFRQAVVEGEVVLAQVEIYKRAELGKD